MYVCISKLLNVCTVLNVLCTQSVATCSCVMWIRKSIFDSVIPLAVALFERERNGIAPQPIELQFYIWNDFTMMVTLTKCVANSMAWHGMRCLTERTKEWTKKRVWVVPEWAEAIDMANCEPANVSKRDQNESEHVSYYYACCIVQCVQCRGTNAYTVHSKCA